MEAYLALLFSSSLPVNRSLRENLLFPKLKTMLNSGGPVLPDSFSFDKCTLIFFIFTAIINNMLECGQLCLRVVHISTFFLCETLLLACISYSLRYCTGDL